MILEPPRLGALDFFGAKLLPIDLVVMNGQAKRATQAISVSDQVGDVSDLTCAASSRTA